MAGHGMGTTDDYCTARNIGEEQSLANWRMFFKPSKLNPSNWGMTVLNMWIQLRLKSLK